LTRNPALARAAAAIVAAAIAGCRSATFDGPAPPESVSENVSHVRGLLRELRGEETVVAARALVAKEPGNLRAHALLQDALDSVGRLSEAVDEARRRYDASPGSFEALLLARVTDDPHACEGLLREAVGKAPEDPWPRYALGATLRARGRVDEARAQLERAVSGAGAPPEAWRELAEIWADLGEAERAEATFAALVRSGEATAEDHLRRGAVLLTMLERAGDAERAFRAANAARPGDLSARKGIAAALLAQSRARQAVAALEAILAEFPHDEDCVWNLAIAWQDHLRDRRRAIDAYRRYVDLGGENAWLARQILENLESERAEDPATSRSIPASVDR
jgi:tetratricopeptide (TPR) repeat protein